MPRTLSASFRQAVESRYSDAVDLVFLTISHPTLAEAIRVVSDTVDYVYDGETWTGFPFDLQLLSDDDQPPQAKLEIQNVDTLIGRTVRALSLPPRLKIELLSSADFDLNADPRTALGTPSVEYTADALFLVDVTMDAMTVSGTIRGWDFLQRVWPGRRATQDRYPGLFR